MSDELRELTNQKVNEAIDKLYGPKWCEHCQKVQKVVTHELQGSQTTQFKDNIVTFGFTGTRSCSVCFRNIEPRTNESGE